MDQEFVDYIKNHIKEYLPSKYIDAQIETEEVIKGNDESIISLFIDPHDNNIVPSVSLNPFYEQFKEGKSYTEILKELAYSRVNLEPYDSLVFEKFFNYNFVKPLLTLRLYDRDKNEEFLRDKPYTSLGEYVITYRIQPIYNKDGKATIPIDETIFSYYNIPLEQLHKDAINAEASREEVVFYEIQDFILGGHKNLFNQDKPLKKHQSQLYVLTNESNLNGAAVIALDNVLEKVAFLLDCDFYVLPSSINELMIYPAYGPMRTKELEQMVKEANLIAVSPHDYLSDKVQYYNRKTKKFGPERYCRPFPKK